MPGPSFLPPFDFQRTFALQQLGRFDPTAELSATAFSKAWVTPEGPARVIVRATSSGVRIESEGAPATAFAAWSAPADGHAEFEGKHPIVVRLHRAYAGLRILRMPWMFDVACGAILQQRVTIADAMRGFARIVRSHGEPHSDAVPRWPAPERLARLPSWAFPALGIDPKRGRALVALARAEAGRPFLDNFQSFAALRARLLALPGIGPWTTEMVLGFGAGDPDALPLGDLHLPRLVAAAFRAEQPPSDALMVQLLEPYRGHRFRVARLILSAQIARRR